MSVVDLDIARADKEGDCRLVSPLSILKELVADLESGEWPEIDMLYIAMKTKPDADGMSAFPLRCAGGTRLELMGLLVEHTSIAVNK